MTFGRTSWTSLPTGHLRRGRDAVDGRDRLAAQLRRGALDGLEDLQVPRAAAEVARARVLDRVARRARVAVEERLARPQEAGRAVAALRGVEIRERGLKGVRAVLRGDAL